MRIVGQGYLNTNLSMIYGNQGETSIWYECKYWRCWIGIQGLSLYSSRTDTDDIAFVAKGGTMYVYCIMLLLLRQIN